MSESNQEGYQTLGWIINKSEYGLFLAIADEEMQNEIARVYRRGMVRIYDYKEHPKAYSFLDLKKWIENFLEIQTFLIINFQFAIQGEDDLKRLNFSRDMMAGLGKNLIFFTTPYGDDMLASEAYDFYCFIKIRILFSSYNNTVNEENRDLKADFLQESFEQNEEWDSEEAKKKLKEVDILLREAKEAEKRQEYHKSEISLLKVMEISKKILGSEHLGMTIIYSNLAGLYESQGRYKEAEELYKKAVSVDEKILGENHKDTAVHYNNLAGLYGKQERYKEAEELYKKAIAIDEKILGENHPDAAIDYNNLAVLYQNQQRYEEAEKLYKKALSIHEKILGENHPGTITIKENLMNLNKNRK